MKSFAILVFIFCSISLAFIFFPQVGSQLSGSGVEKPEVDDVLLSSPRPVNHTLANSPKLDRKLSPIVSVVEKHAIGKHLNDVLPDSSEATLVEQDAVPIDVIELTGTDLRTNDDIEENIESEFKSGGRDGRLSYAKEQQYIDIISSSEELAQYVFSEAECTMDKCKLSFLVSDKRQREQLANHLIARLLENHRVSGIKLGEDRGDGIANFYFSDADSAVVNN